LSLTTGGLKPGPGAAAGQSFYLDLDGADVGGFFALGASAAFKRYALVFSQALEAIGLDVAKVGKEISAAIVRLDEAEALGIVKPFNRAGLSTHVYFLLMMKGIKPTMQLGSRNATEENQTGMALEEQDGKETNNDDLMQAQNPLYR
jgi:hypothetical protein